MCGHLNHHKIGRKVTERGEKPTATAGCTALGNRRHPPVARRRPGALIPATVRSAHPSTMSAKRSRSTPSWRTENRIAWNRVSVSARVSQSLVSRSRAPGYAYLTAAPDSEFLTSQARRGSEFRVAGGPAVVSAHTCSCTPDDASGGRHAPVSSAALEHDLSA